MVFDLPDEAELLRHTLPLVMAQDDVDVVVELVGGENGIAKETIELALDNGKDVVTANKALLAIHGQALASPALRDAAWLRCGTRA